MRVLVSGSSGMIGSALVERLNTAGHKVVRLVRSNPKQGEVLWNTSTGVIDDGGLEGFDAVVHLGGVGVGEKRWNESEKERIWNSRVVTTEFLAKRLLETVSQPKVFVCASATGYYGDGGETVLAEESPPGEGFMAELCLKWEEASKIAEEAGIRVVNLRSGVVLSPSGGALAKQLPMFRLCLGGRLGSGQQYLSWISLHDEVSAILHVLETPELSGPVNLTSPNPVRNVVFTAELADAVKRPAIVPVWPWLLRVAFGRELSEELLLASQRVRPARLLASGFEFRDLDLGKALRQMIRATPPPPSKQSDRSAVVDISDHGKQKKGRRNGR